MLQSDLEVAQTFQRKAVPRRARYHRSSEEEADKLMAMTLSLGQVAPDYVEERLISRLIELNPRPLDWLNGLGCERGLASLRLAWERLAGSPTGRVDAAKRHLAGPAVKTPNPRVPVRWRNGLDVITT